MKKPNTSKAENDERIARVMSAIGDFIRSSGRHKQSRGARNDKKVIEQGKLL